VGREETQLPLGIASSPDLQRLIESILVIVIRTSTIPTKVDDCDAGMEPS
jgi:hypothetical protein